MSTRTTFDLTMPVSARELAKAIASSLGRDDAIVRFVVEVERHMEYLGALGLADHLASVVERVESGHNDPDEDEELLRTAKAFRQEIQRRIREVTS